MLNLGEMFDGLESLDKVIDQANRFLWNIAIQEWGEYWHVKAGEKSLIVTDNREAAEALVYGMGLAYCVIPEHVHRAFLVEYGLEQEYDEYLRQSKQEEGGN